MAAAIALEAAAAPGAGAQGPITSGEMREGAISPAGDSDTWTFHAEAGNAIVVRAGESGVLGSFAPQLTLLGPGAVPLSTDWGNAAAEVSTIAAVAGTYSVVVQDLSNSYIGTYRVTLVRAGSPATVSPGDDGGTMTNGAMHLGYLEVGDLDLWTVSADSGQSIVVRMGEMSGNPAPQLRIYGPNGAPLSTTWGNLAAEVAVVVPMDGTYLVTAGDNSLAAPGGYRLTLAKVGGPVTVSPGDDGGAMTNGAVHVGNLEVGDLDLWTVSAESGQSIVVRMGEMSGNPAPQLRIYSPAGGLPISTDWGNLAAEVAVVAPMDGTYLVTAGDNSLGATGGYRLTLAKVGGPVTVSPGDDGGAMTNGAMHVGNLEVGDLDLWTVSADSGQSIVVRMGEMSGNPAPQLRIYSPAGGLPISTDWGNLAAEVGVVAPMDGTYLVTAGDNSLGATGDYRLTLAKVGSPVTVSPGDEGGPLGAVPVETGFIQVGDLDVWTLHTNAGESIVVTMSETTTGSPLAPRLRLYGPGGSLIQSSWGNTSTQVSTTAPVTGIYLVVAADNGLGASGGYTLAHTGALAVPSTPRPGGLVLAPPFPNPFSAGNALRFETPADGGASLRVFDARGRLVRTLVDESSLPAGEHEVRWDGQDASGSRIPSGLYFVRLDSAGQSTTRKVLLSRGN